MKKIVLLLLLVTIFNKQLAGQDSTFPLDSLPEMMVLLSGDAATGANLPDIEAVANWLDPCMDSLKSLVLQSNVPREYTFVFTFLPDTRHRGIVSTCPPLLEEEYQKFYILINGFPNSPKSLYTPTSIAYQLNHLGGCPDEESYAPSWQTPEMEWQERFDSSNLATKIVMLNSWAKDDIMPVIGQILTTIDTSFTSCSAENIQDIGAKVVQYDISQDIYHLTYNNDKYWRGMLDIGYGDYIIPLSRILMHVSKGEYEKVYQQIKFYYALSFDNFSKYVFYELEQHIADIDSLAEIEVSRGILLHDQKEYEKAIEVYEELLKIYPSCTHAIYELFLSTYALHLTRDNINKSKELWTKYEPIIHNKNPFFATQPIITSPKDAFQFARRIEIKHVNWNEDFLTKLGAITLDLEEYGIAAEYYWLSILLNAQDQIETEKRLHYFLYALDKVGNTDIRQDHDFDYEKVFSEIDKIRQQEMENNFWYQQQKKKN